MIYLDRNLKIPLYQQLYEQIKKEISTGALKTGEKLPSIREMSSAHCISQNTVKNAYSQLCIEGYIQNKIGSGFFAEDIKQTCLPLNYSMENTVLNDMPKEAKNEHFHYDFQYGNTESQSFPVNLWLRYSKEILYSYKSDKIGAYGNKQGELALRLQLTKYLKTLRGVNCTPEQIVITSGLQRSIEIICSLFEKSDKTLAIENPSYDMARIVFINNGFKIIPIFTDNEGIDINALMKTNVKLVFITPSHQFPLGSVMPISKRVELLNWAHEKNAYIVEDDYDCELCYHHQPIPSLQAISDGNNVIYTGTFSQSLSPCLRMSYMVLPPTLLNKYNKIYKRYYCEVPWLQQHIMVEFIREGNWEKHIRKGVKISTKKHDLIVSCIEKYMGDRIKIHGKNSGTHLLLEFTNGEDGEEMIKKAKKRSVKIYSVKPYFAEGTDYMKNAVMLGYTGIKLSDIENGIKALSEAWF